MAGLCIGMQVNEAGKCAILEVRSLEQISVMKAPALVRMAIIPVTPEALDRSARLAGSPKDKEPEVQKRIEVARPIVAEVQVTFLVGMCSNANFYDAKMLAWVCLMSLT